MSEHERTGHRPSGFSLVFRDLIAPGRPLRDVTRHIDLDGWPFLCDFCAHPIALLEQKFRPESPPPKLATSEWQFVRALAEDAGIPALGIAWTNAERNSNERPDELHIQVCLHGALLPEPASPSIERLEVLLVRALEKHREERCRWRARTGGRRRTAAELERELEDARARIVELENALTSW